MRAFRVSSRAARTPIYLEMGEETIHEAIEASAQHNEKLDGALLVGWIVVSEWLSADGTRSLVRMAGTPDGTTPPSWQTRGYLHESLFGDWTG